MRSSADRSSPRAVRRPGGGRGWLVAALISALTMLASTVAFNSELAIRASATHAGQTSAAQSNQAAAAPPPAASPQQPAVKNVASSKPLPKSQPLTIQIPSIGVHSGKMIDLGVTGSGALAVPGDAVTIGWYDHSPTPGEKGPAVIAGHVNYGSVPGVFARLGDVKVNNEVTVKRADGKTAVFTVYQVKLYPKSNFPTKDVYGNTGGSEIRLITCGGDYDAANRNYLSNVVVYAKLTGVQV